MALRPSVKLNGVVLPPHIIAAEAQHHPSRTPAAAFRSAAQALMIRTLLLEEAARRGIAATPELIAPGKRELDDEAHIRVLIEEQIPIGEPDESRCRAFYDADPSRFRSPDLFEASHILFQADQRDGEAVASAVSRAEAVIAELNEAPGLFEAIARERSDCDSRSNGGRLGQITSGETVVEFERALRDLDEGEISQIPIMTPFGAHVLRLDARAGGHILPYDYAHDRIVAYLAEQEWRQNVAAYIRKLVDAARIEGVDMSTSTLGPVA